MIETVVALLMILKMLVNVVDGLQQRIELLENGEVRTQASTDAEFSGEVF